MNFKSWTIGKKLWFLAITSVLILAAVEVFNNVTTRRLSAQLIDIGRTQLPAVRSMTLVDMMHDGLRAVVYRSIIASYTENKTEMDEASEEYETFSKEIIDHLKEIEKADVSNLIKEQVQAANIEVTAYVVAGKDVLEIAKSQNTSDALKKLPAFQEAFKALEGKLEKLGNDIENQAQASVAESEKTAESAKSLGFVIAILGIAFSLMFSIWVSRDLEKTLRSTATRLDDQGQALKGYTEEVDQSAVSLSDSSTKQASAVQQTASAMEEINAMVARTAENSGRLAESSQSSHEAVEEGRVGVAQMLVEMESIRSGNTQVANEINSSNEQIKKIVLVISEISEKTKVINDIVFQTKLLSFNASVEAARAGEHGKGFAVVAEEVGNLAQMSGTAAKDISDMLENGVRQVNEIVDSNRARTAQIMQESAKKIDSGKVVAEQFGQVFEKIVTQVGEVSSLSKEISTAIGEQRTGLEEINKAISLFSESAQATSITAQSASEVSKNLKASFKNLSHLMAELQLLVNGAKANSKNSNVLKIHTTKSVPTKKDLAS